MTDSPASIQIRDAHRSEFDRVFDIRTHASSVPAIPNATPIAVEDLTANPSNHIDGTDESVLVICDIGVRSLAVVGLLRTAGYVNTVSLDGGMEAWIEARLPIDTPDDLLSEEFVRYDRQIKLPNLGVEGQVALKNARVAIVGAGGLGVPVLMYLAGAGVGHMTVIDSDDIDVSNLHRQSIYTSNDAGTPKSDAAVAFAKALNPWIDVRGERIRLSEENATSRLADHDLVVACTDNIETTQAINQATRALGIPMIFASVYRTEGQMAVFVPSDGPCYACVFPPGREAASFDCSIVGVLGTVTGTLGSMQATEAIKLITGMGESSSGKLFLYDALTQELESVTLPRNPECPVCGGSEER